VRNYFRTALGHLPYLKPLLERLEYYRQFEKFCPLGHYYSPVPALDAAVPRTGQIAGDSGTTVPGVDLNTDAQRGLIGKLAGFYSQMPFGQKPRPGVRYCFDTSFFTHADAILLYSMIRHVRPRRIIEVGSGWSSAVALDTNELFLGGEIACSFVEPDPVRLLSLLKEADHRTVRIYPYRVQGLDISIFRELEQGDILFIDSSHVTKVGSDVNHLLFEVLPQLAAGVYVHFHDVFFPFEYPSQWISEGRAWNEAYLLRAFLQYNRAFQIVCFGAYLQQTMPEELARTMPLAMKSAAQSLWLQKIA
jgi:hypothetical protein